MPAFHFLSLPFLAFLAFFLHQFVFLSKKSYLTLHSFFSTSSLDKLTSSFQFLVPNWRLYLTRCVCPSVRPSRRSSFPDIEYPALIIRHPESGRIPSCYLNCRHLLYLRLYPFVCPTVRHAFLKNVRIQVDVSEFGALFNSDSLELYF